MENLLTSKRMVKLNFALNAKIMFLISACFFFAITFYSSFCLSIELVSNNKDELCVGCTHYPVEVIQFSSWSVTISCNWYITCGAPLRQDVSPTIQSNFHRKLLLKIKTKFWVLKHVSECPHKVCDVILSFFLNCLRTIFRMFLFIEIYIYIYILSLYEPSPRSY